MPFRCIKHADGGAHGDVYKGEDGLGRPVCVKVIRPSVGDSTFVLEQAKALARVNSPNVALVLDITDVNDPESGKTVPAIIMEWIEGKDLDKVLSGPKLSSTEARRIGLGVIAGMEAIHAAKVAHRDFHVRNVMIAATVVKIIDILYYDTLAVLSSDSRERQYQIDRNALRSMLANILEHSNCGLAEVDAFRRCLSANLNFDQIRIAFDRASLPAKLAVREKSAAEILGNLKGITLASKFREKVEELYLGRRTQEPGWQATVHGLPSKLPGGLWHCMFREAGSGSVVAATTVEDLSMLRSGDSVTVSGRIREVSQLDYVGLEDARISTKPDPSESGTVTFSMPPAWRSKPNAETVEAVTQRIVDWDGENRQAPYQWLRNHGRTHDEVMAMDWFATRMAFSTAVPIGSNAITNTPISVRFEADTTQIVAPVTGPRSQEQDSTKRPISRSNPGRMFQVTKGSFGNWAEGSTFTEYEFRRAVGDPKPPHPGVDPVTHLNDYFAELLDRGLRLRVIRIVS